MNNSILVDWDGKGNLIKEYFTIVYADGYISIYAHKSITGSMAFMTGVNRNDSDFESKLDTWVRTYRGLLR